MSTGLFDPLELGPLTLRNRIVVSPMCQYSAIHGAATDWHLMHIGQFAVANPGLIFLEGTAVERNGCISPGDLCLFNRRHERALGRVLDFVREHSESRLGIQLFHAGRKGSQYRPWGHRPDQSIGGDTLPLKQGGWPLCAPSAVAYADAWPIPEALSRAGLTRLRNAFIKSARHAARVGLDVLELHYAHGYLLHTFLSPVSNRRTDKYGGSIENRLRFPLEVFRAVRDVWPHDRVLGARISGCDFGLARNAWRIADATVFAGALRDEGCDFLDVSGGFLSPEQNFTEIYTPAWQVELAARIKIEVGLPTITVGAITHPRQADTIVREGKADAVALARGMIYDPRWPWHAAFKLGAEACFPPQYSRVFTLDYPAWFNQTP